MGSFAKPGLIQNIIVYFLEKEVIENGLQISANKR